MRVAQFFPTLKLNLTRNYHGNPAGSTENCAVGLVGWLGWYSWIYPVSLSLHQLGEIMNIEFAFLFGCMFIAMCLAVALLVRAEERARKLEERLDFYIAWNEDLQDKARG